MSEGNSTDRALDALGEALGHLGAEAKARQTDEALGLAVALGEALLASVRAMLAEVRSQSESGA